MTINTGATLGLNIAAGIVALAVLLAASEVMVRSLSRIGGWLGLPEAGLGFLVALGADAPEISTALTAVLGGSASIGVGVVEGSNIYNLAGLLGVSAIVAGPLLLSRRQIGWGGAINVFAAVLASALILGAGVLAIRITLGLALIICLAMYVWHQGRHERSTRSKGPIMGSTALSVLSIGAVVGASIVLVHAARAVVTNGGMPVAVMSVVVLPVSTSLPNTWAAVTLARKRLGAAVISTTLNSNLINLALGVGLPSLFIKMTPEHAAVVFDGPVLIGMTGLATIMLATSMRLSRAEGSAIIGLYALYLVLRFTAF